MTAGTCFQYQIPFPDSSISSLWESLPAHLLRSHWRECHASLVGGEDLLGVDLKCIGDWSAAPVLPGDSYNCLTDVDIVLICYVIIISYDSIRIAVQFIWPRPVGHPQPAVVIRSLYSCGMLNAVLYLIRKVHCKEIFLQNKLVILIEKINVEVCPAAWRIHCASRVPSTVLSLFPCYVPRMILHARHTCYYGE